MSTDLDGFRALNPSDGLFLRAEHLEAIQSYAASLARATATTSGTGVAHGLGVSLSDDGTALHVTPGLAVSPTGRLLRLASTLTLPLEGEHVPPRRTNGFWVVELHWASGTSGSTPVYGSLCDDGCDPSGSGRTIRPWRDEGVELRLVADDLPGLDATLDDVRRSWLASAYFERERASGAPWVVPTGRDALVDSLGGRPWDDETALPQDAGVPLAVLQDVGGEWCLDVWTARRLLDGTAALARWDARLARRPWPVFLAQLLQLEDSLSGAALGPGQDPKRLVVLDVEVEDALREPVERFIKEIADTPVVRWHQFKDLLEATRGPARQRHRAVAARSLRGLGLLELPPGGYLDVDETREDLMGVLDEFFGGRVDLHRRDVRADEVAGLVASAQHRDRIPLESDLGRPQVDVLVPSRPADKPELYAASYGWVAFVRSATAERDVPDQPGGRTDDVVAYGHWSIDERPAEEFREGRVGNAKAIGKLVYPAGGWEFPDGDTAAQARSWMANAGNPYAVVALAANEDRLPLAALRASLFVASLDNGIDAVPVHAFVSADGEEAVVLVFRVEIG